MPSPSTPRAWRADAGMLLLAFVIGVFFYVDNLNSGDEVHPAVDLAVGLVCCALLLLRRRWPVGVALGLIPTIVLSSFTIGPTTLALYAVARYRSWRVTLAVVGLHAGVMIGLYALLAEEHPDVFWPATTITLALDAAVVASGRLVRSQQLLVESLRERAVAAEEGNRLRLEEVRHTERERIAREMHDVLAHRLSLLAVHAGALEVRRTAPAEEREAAGVVRQSAYAALEDLRVVIGMLRGPEEDRPQPTLSDLPALVEQSRRAGTDVTLAEPLPTAPDGLGRHVYRIVQEGLTNARKHAPGAPVLVALARPDAGLTVEITNPVPAGGTRIPGAGTGLVGLRERVDLVGGRLEHGRTPDGEFRLHAWLPWPP